MTVQTLISSVDSRHKSQNVESSGYLCEEKRQGQEEFLDKDDDELEHVEVFNMIPSKLGSGEYGGDYKAKKSLAESMISKTNPVDKMTTSTIVERIQIAQDMKLGINMDSYVDLPYNALSLMY